MNHDARVFRGICPGCGETLFWAQKPDTERDESKMRCSDCGLRQIDVADEKPEHEPDDENHEV